MPQLDWSEYAFIECLEVLPTVEEYDTQHEFRVVQQDLTLVVTVWQLESVVAIDVTRTGSDVPVIGLVLIVRGGTRHLKGPDSECIEFTDVAIVPSSFSYMDYGRRKIDVYDSKQMPGLDVVRLFIKPGIRIDIPRYPLPL